MLYVDIEKETLDNTDYRRVINTTDQNQVVLMSIPPREDIPMEIHHGITQFIRFEGGEGVAYIDDIEYKVGDGIALNIPAETPHRIVNTSVDKPLKLYAIYSPPEHPHGLVQHTKPKDNSVNVLRYTKLMLLSFP